MPSLRLLGLVPVVVIVSLAGACTGDDPTPASPLQDAGADTSTTPSDGAAPPDDAASTLGSLAIDPPVVRILRNGTASAKITLTRNGFAGDVQATFAGLPTGVTAVAQPIAAGTTSADVTFTADGTAAFGVGSFTLKAPEVADATATIAVAGPPGSLDETFDQDGYVLDGALSATGVFYAVAVQPDGKIVAAGTTNPSGGGWTVRRYGTDGAPDATFNTKAAAAIPTTGAARGIAFDPMKGRIVVVGSYVSSGERLAIVRLNADGSADQGFGSSGTMSATPVDHSQGSRGYSVIVNADSTMLIAGFLNTTTPGAFVEKYDAAGLRIDTGFTNYYDAVNKGQFSTILPLTMGTFIATGTDSQAAPPDQQAVRFEAKGTPDSTFGVSGGRRTYASGCTAGGATLTKSGDVVMVGQNVMGPSFCETRIAASGTGNFLWTKDLGGGGSEQFVGVTNGGLATTADTSYAVGFGGGTYDKYGEVTHRLANGDLDASWGTAGERKFEDPNTPDTYGFQFRAVTSTPEGRLVIAGFRTGATAGYLLARIWE